MLPNTIPDSQICPITLDYDSDNKMLIFSYGSNMNLNRLAQRVPSAVKVSNAFLPDYQFVCNKVSKDGSAKANIVKSDIPGELVWGVLFNIDSKEKPMLDKAEGLGLGYNEDTLTFLTT